MGMYSRILNGIGTFSVFGEMMMQKGIGIPSRIGYIRGGIYGTGATQPGAKRGSISGSSMYDRSLHE